MWRKEGNSNLKGLKGVHAHPQGSPGCILRASEDRIYSSHPDPIVPGSPARLAIAGFRRKCRALVGHDRAAICRRGLENENAPRIAVADPECFPSCRLENDRTSAGDWPSDILRGMLRKQ